MERETLAMPAITVEGKQVLPYSHLRLRTILGQVGTYRRSSDET